MLLLTPTLIELPPSFVEYPFALITLSVISIIGYSAMAGTVGAGGVGAVALTYGYQRFDNAVMCYTVITLILIVQLLQGAGNLAYKKLK